MSPTVGYTGLKAREASQTLSIGLCANEIEDYFRIEYVPDTSGKGHADRNS